MVLPVFLQILLVLVLCSCLQWDEALLTMSKGEKARLEIEPEWAYGKKGQPDAKYPFSLCNYRKHLRKMT